MIWNILYTADKYCEKALSTFFSWTFYDEEINFTDTFSDPKLSKQQLEEKEIIQSVKHRKNFASSKSGATILKCSEGIDNRDAILSKSQNSYLTISECNNKQTENLILNLSDDI